MTTRAKVIRAQGMNWGGVTALGLVFGWDAALPGIAAIATIYALVLLSGAVALVRSRA
jgi:hypothetical protein